MRKRTPKAFSFERWFDIMFVPSNLKIYNLIHHEEFALLRESNLDDKKHNYTLYIFSHTSLQDCVMYELKSDKLFDNKQQYIDYLRHQLQFLAIKEYMSLTKPNYMYELGGLASANEEIESFIDLFSKLKPIKRTKQNTYYDITTFRVRMIRGDFDYINILMLGVNSYLNDIFFISDFGKQNYYNMVKGCYFLMEPENSLRKLCEKYHIDISKLNNVYDSDYNEHFWYNPKMVNDIYVNFPNVVKTDRYLSKYITYEEFVID